MADYDYRQFDDIPVGVTFADKFGRLHTKTDANMAVNQGSYVNDFWRDELDTTSGRSYIDADEDERDEVEMWTPDRTTAWT